MKTRTLGRLATVIALILMAFGSIRTLAAQPKLKPFDRVSTEQTANENVPDIQFSMSDGEHPPVLFKATSLAHASPAITETVGAGTAPKYPGSKVLSPPLLPESIENDSKRETCNNKPLSGPSSLASTMVGGPDLFGYTFTDNDQPAGPTYNFVDISATGTSVNLWDDDGSGPFSIGFDFPFYGQIKHEFYISSNGYIAFNGYDLPDPGNDCPIVDPYDPDDIIALYWDDLDPSMYGDQVYYDTLTPCPYTGHGTCLVVQYENYHLFGGQTAGTFEAVLLETGDILIQFQDAGVEAGYGSTTGIENSTHTDGLTYACNDYGSIHDGLAVLFSYPYGLSLRKTVDDVVPNPGQRITYTLVLKSFEQDVTEVVVSDTLPAGLTFAAPVTLDPPQAGATLAQSPSDLPILASGLTISEGESISLTFPVMVDQNASGVIVNSAAVTSAEMTEPERDQVAISVIGSCDTPANPIVNCSFETGNLAGWVAQDIADPTFALQVGGPGIDLGYGAFVSDPTHGNYAALHGFDGAGPGTIKLGQDVTLPPGFFSLEFLYRAGWDLTSYGAYQNRHFVVRVEPRGGGPYPLQTTTILTANAGTAVADTGKSHGQVGLSDFAGQTVRITFAWDVPERYSGPAFFQLDNVFIREHVPPTFTTWPVVSATEDLTYTYHIAATDQNPLEPLLFTMPISPTWLHLIDHHNGTATLTGVPVNADVGPNPVELRVENSLSAASTQSFIVTVENVNDPPAFTSTPTPRVLKENLYTYEVVAADEDVGDKLSITAPTLPTWLALTDRGDGTAALSGIPPQAGKYDVRLQVSDGIAQADQSFSITAYASQLLLPIVFHDASVEPDQVSILAWTLYTDYYEEYWNSLSAIERFYTDFSLAETTALDAAALQADLVGIDVLLIPEQEYQGCYSMSSIGADWSTVLEQFLQQGGTLIVLDYGGCMGSSYCLLKGAGLLDVVSQNCSYYTGDYTLRAVQPSHPLLKELPASFQGEDGTLHFESSDGTEIVEETAYGASVVLTKDVGQGHLALIGFDFYAYNDDMARLLANAVQWR